MTTSIYNISTYSRFNLSESESDITVFVKEYRERIKKQLAHEEEGGKTSFVSFAQKRFSVTDVTWLQDNRHRFLQDTRNETLLKLDYLAECGFICCMEYSPEGDSIIVGHSTGLIQRPPMEQVGYLVVDDSARKHPMWKKLEEMGLRKYHYPYETQQQAATKMRHGSTGTVLCTLRNIQFPPKPIYSIEYSTSEERVCYASCMDGAVYRIEIPNIDPPLDDPPAYCIKADPALETLNLQFYGSPGISSYSTPFITQRSPALSLGLSYDQTNMIVGYADGSIKVYDMETQEAFLTYKVHKLRLQFIPKKLQRMHFGQVCAVRCHKERPYMFASGAWDNTLRIWDTRCQVGCVMTFEGVDIRSDSIDLNRDHCIAGSWKPTEALTLWDLVARKKLSVIRVQNRRPDIDGEYIYACRYWRSSDYNRKGKYGIIGGSGTNCVEVINLHNRYISCSFPAPGTVLAVTSHQHRIAFGGTAPTFTIVSFYDPKHEKEKYEKEEEPDFDYTKPEVILYEDDYGEDIHTPEQLGEIETSTKTSE